MNNVLVTGGAGYIGSHVVKLLGQSGHRVVTLDNLSKGFREAVTYGDLVVGDTGDGALVSRLLREYDVDTVMHFAFVTTSPFEVLDLEVDEEIGLFLFRNEPDGRSLSRQRCKDCAVAHSPELTRRLEVVHQKKIWSI